MSCHHERTRRNGIPHDQGSNAPKLIDSRSARFARVRLCVPKNRGDPHRKVLTREKLTAPLSTVCHCHSIFKPDAVPAALAHDTIPIAEAARLLRGLVQPVLSPPLSLTEIFPRLDCFQALKGDENAIR